MRRAGLILVMIAAVWIVGGCGGSDGETCGSRECGAGEVCCNAACGICMPEGSAAPCPACPQEDAATSGSTCGPVTCGPGQRCCDHCSGSCVPEDSGAFCPDDNEPDRVCTDGGAGIADASTADGG
jgi:hypothetical protein